MERWKRGILAEIILFFILISLNNSFVLAFISIIAHEAAHIVIAKKMGVSLMIFKFIYMELKHNL